MESIFELLAGVDEAGRGPLAGPVVAAAVILNPERPIAGLTDSKQLSASKRERLFIEIRRHALAWSAAQANVLEIDQRNILQATFLAMQRAVDGLSISPVKILVDGNACPTFSQPADAIIQGDLLVPAISAASIVAKVLRDRIMRLFDKRYPQYGFAAHKGYGTKAHMAALRQFGPCPLHRQSYAPVAAIGRY